MTYYADTSFVASLYLTDSHSQAAERTMQATGAVLPLTDFGAFELKNSVRAAVVRRSLTESEAQRTLASIDQDVARRRFVPTDCDWNAVFRLAETLSKRHTFSAGYRALDILHVATACVLKCSDFLTYDRRQVQLAQKAGLQTLP